ncbi:MAG: hypothetical protein HYZ49_18800 [Chloroflexi bacterium]|nr:hypothetical protein [Chloroflexota bacterium]
MLSHFWRFAAVVLILFALGVPRSIAFACTPPPGGLPFFSVTDHVNAAPIVLEGVVIATAGQYFPEIATIQIVQYIKGNGPSTIKVAGYGPSSVCLSSVVLGDHFVFYVSGDDVNGYQAFYLSQFDSIAPADSQTLAEAAAASGQQPIFLSPAEPILTQVAAVRGSDGTPAPTLDRSPILTEVYATSNAAVAAYATDPAGQSVILTQAAATLFTLSATPVPCASTHSIAEHTQAADVVAEGVVTQTDGGIVAVQVVQYFKKSNSSFSPNLQLNIIQSANCSLALSVGDHYIFYALGDPVLPVYALNQDNYVPIAPVDETTIAEITAASGQEPEAVQSLEGIILSLSATGTVTALPPQLATVTPTPTPFSSFNLTPTPFITPVPPPNPFLTVESLTLAGICGIVALLVGLGLGVAATLILRQRD